MTKYHDCIKDKLDVIYDSITKIICIRSKCDWYEHSEKSTFWGNLEKQRGTQNTVKNLIVNIQEITDQTLILECVWEFYESLFKKRKQKSVVESKSFLSYISIPKLSEDKTTLCEIDLTENDLFDSLKSMQNDNSPGNNGLAKEFHKKFWNELKEMFVDSVSETIEKGHLSTYQRQKEDIDKRFIQNWRQFFLLNIDLKMMSKALTDILVKAGD